MSLQGFFLSGLEDGLGFYANKGLNGGSMMEMQVNPFIRTIRQLSFESFT